eukprot:gene21477-biopygen22178
MGPQPHTYGRGRGRFLGRGRSGVPRTPLRPRYTDGAPWPSVRGRESALGFPPRPPNAPALQVTGARAAGTPQTPQGGRCAGPLF